MCAAEMMNVRASTVIKSGYRKEHIFEKVKRVEDFPRIMPDIKKVTILETGPVSGASEWDADIDGCPLYWKERDTFDNERLIFEFKSIEGDFDVFTGCWSVHDDSGGTRVDFSVEYLVGIPVIEEIIGPILKKKIERNISGMLADLKGEIEALNPTKTRNHSRIKTSIRISARARSQERSSLILNLSEGGAAICLPEKLLGEKILELKLPHAEMVRKIPAEIVWRCREQREAGIRFLDIDNPGDPVRRIIRELMIHPAA